MENKVYSISYAKNPAITVHVTPGHFTTSNAHTNNFLDVNVLKSNVMLAQDTARELAIPYLSSTLVDTIVCIERMDIIGAYLAQELLRDGTSVINSGNTINVLSPMTNAYGNLVFPSNMISCISGKNILLLVASISSGRALSRVIECVAYYGGSLCGISALYLASASSESVINALFTSEDIPGYKLYQTQECEMCKNGIKLDGIISSEGYTKIE